jgi:hypothetical protein
LRLPLEAFPNESQTLIQTDGPRIWGDDSEIDTVHVQFVKSIRNYRSSYFYADSLAPSRRVTNQNAKLAGAYTMVDLIESGMAQTRVGFPVGYRPDKIMDGLVALFDPFLDAPETVPRAKSAEPARHLRIISVPV